MGVGVLPTESQAINLGGMGAIFDALREALNARAEPLREIARETGVDVSTLSRIVNGVRTGVSLATLETLADYLKLELKPKAKRRRKP